MANISKIQFLRTDTPAKVPTAAQLDVGSLAINMADKKLFTKNSSGAVFALGYSLAESDAKFVPKTTTINLKALTDNIVLTPADVSALGIANRLSELSSGNLALVKTANDNLGSVIAKPITLDQAKGTGDTITSMADPRLTETNQTWTINGTMTDGPADVVVNAAILINTRRAFAAGASISQTLINSGGITYIRTGTGSAGNFTWNGTNQGQKDPNGWRKVFDSVVLPTLVELGAAKSGVNSDITSLNSLNSINGTLAINGDVNIGSGNIVQTGAQRSIQTNYRMGVVRPGGLPYITFTDTTLDGTKFPSSNSGVMSLQGKTAPIDGNFDSGRQLVSMNGYFLPTGGGYLQLRVNDVSTTDPNAAVQTAAIDMYGSQSGNIAGGTIYVRAPLLKTQSRLEVGTGNIDTAQSILMLYTNDGSGVFDGNTLIGYNSGTAAAPVYSNYFRGKGVTNIDTLGGLAVRSNINVIGSGASTMSIGSGGADVYISNSVSGRVLQLKDNGVLAYSDQPIYHTGNKPTAQDVAALPITGGTITGALTVNGVVNFANQVTVPSNSGIQFAGTNSQIKAVQGLLRFTANGSDFIDFDNRQFKNGTGLKINAVNWNTYNSHSFADQFNVAGAVNVNFGQGTEGFLSAFKATSYLSTFGYTTQASMGLLREGGGTWGKLALFVGSDESSEAGHPRAVATLDATGNFNSARLSTNYLTVTGSIDATSDITTRGAVNTAGIYNTGTYYLRSNDRRHIQFSNASGSDTDGYIYKDFNGDLNLLNRSGSASLTSGGNFNINGSFNGRSISATENLIVDSPNNGPHVSYRRSGSQKAYIQYLDEGKLVFWVNGTNFWMNSGGQLYSPGEVYAEGAGNFQDVYIRSDIRDKIDVKPVVNPLDIVDELNGVSYKIKHPDGSYRDSGGLIAQEVREVLPHLVTEDHGSDRLRVNYNGIIGVLVESVKALRAELDAIKGAM